MHVPTCGSTLCTVLTVISDSYMQHLSAEPLLTKAATASTLAVAGDAAAQAAEQLQKPANSRGYDVRRALSFALFGAGYTGCVQHQLFQFYANTCDGSALANVLGIPEAVRTPEAQQLLSATQKTLLNQCGAIPLFYYPLFFAITGSVRGERVDETVARAQRDFGPLMQRNLAFWIPTQFLQFYVLPLELQVPYVCAAGLVWNAILSARALADSPKPKGYAEKRLQTDSFEDFTGVVTPTRGRISPAPTLSRTAASQELERKRTSK